MPIVHDLSLVLVTDCVDVAHWIHHRHIKVSCSTLQRDKTPLLLTEIRGRICLFAEIAAIDLLRYSV